MLDILKKRRSIRKYQHTAVEKRKIEELVKAALLSPSSRNLQPWHFIIVDDRELLNRLSQSKPHGSSFLARAALGIVVLGDPAKCDVWIEDCSIASVIIHLTADNLGLGSCWIQIRERFHQSGQSAGEYVRSVLNIPDQYEVESIIALGYPAEQKDPHRESSLPHSQVHYNGFNREYQ